MSQPCQRLLAALFVATLAPSGLAVAQNLNIGVGLAPAANVNPAGIQTILDTGGPANLDGQLTTARFQWSASPCAAAVKIKIFRPSVSLSFGLPASFSFVAERGPFGVTAPVRNDVLVPYALQDVALSPPVDVEAGDLIAITNLTTCGGPIFQRAPSNFFSPPIGTGSFSVPGDVTSSVPNPRAFKPWVFVFATGTSPEFALLSGRFITSLVATDPRTGVTAQGVANLLSNGAGYFSLPAFTGDSKFPEVMVKMVDASREVSLGGTFWFFHAPLTDVMYKLTVKDRATGAVKAYTNTSASPGQLCGAIDTSAFPGP